MSAQRMWLWEHADDIEGHPAVAQYHGLDEAARFFDSTGQRLSDRIAEVSVTELVHWDHPFPDVIRGPSESRIVTGATRDVLERFCKPDELDFVRVRIVGQYDEPWWLLVVVAAWPVVDWEGSTLRTRGFKRDVVNGIDALVARDLSDAPACFRMAEYPTETVVRDDLRRALAELDSPGHFRPLQEFTVTGPPDVGPGAA